MKLIMAFNKYKASLNKVNLKYVTLPPFVQIDTYGS